jgi:hypothetical protein
MPNTREVDVVTLTNQATIVASQALATLVKVKRPMLGALKMRQLARLLTTQLEDYDAERRKLLEIRGEHDDDGRLKEKDGQVLFALDDPTQTPPEDGVREDGVARAAFAADFGELLLATWDCPVVLAVKDFGGLDTEPEHLIALGDLLEEPAPEKGAPALVKE